jgi:hypothetical protein
MTKIRGIDTMAWENPDASRPPSAFTQSKSEHKYSKLLLGFHCGLLDYDIMQCCRWTAASIFKTTH